MRVLDYAVSIIDGYVSSDCSVAELDLANFRNTMETIGGGKLLRRHMNNCSYVTN